MANIDFENIEEKFENTLKTEEWKKLVQDFDDCDDIYIVANGGLWRLEIMPRMTAQDYLQRLV